MRRLFLLVAAVVLVDTMFFAAVAPLLPHYTDELGLSKSAAGVLAAAYPAGTFVGLAAGRLVAAARFGVKPTLLAGLTLLALDEPRLRVRSQRRAAGRGPLRAGRGRSVLVGRRPRLAGVRHALRSPRRR